MAKAAARLQIKLKSSESHFYYYTMKNKRNTPDRMELRKYDPVLRRHVNFKEEKYKLWSLPIHYQTGEGKKECSD